MQKIGIGPLGFMAAVFLACALFGCGSSGHPPAGFRGIKWGAKLSSVPGLHKVGGQEDLGQYDKPGEVLQMGDIKLDKVVYVFYKDRFYMGMAYFSSESFMKMEALLTGKFGKPAEVDQNPDNLVWDSDRVSVVLSPEGAKEIRLVYMYKPIQLRVELKK